MSRLTHYRPKNNWHWDTSQRLDQKTNLSPNVSLLRLTLTTSLICCCLCSFGELSPSPSGTCRRDASLFSLHTQYLSADNEWNKTNFKKASFSLIKHTKARFPPLQTVFLISVFFKTSAEKLLYLQNHQSFKNTVTLSTWQNVWPWAWNWLKLIVWQSMETFTCNKNVSLCVSLCLCTPRCCWLVFDGAAN